MGQNLGGTSAATPHPSPAGGRRTVGRWALRTRLLGVLVVVGIIPFALVGWQAVRRVGQADLTAAQSRVEAASVSAGELIDRNLFERYGDVQAFAASPTVKRAPATAAEVTDTFTRLYGLYDLMVVTDADGIVVAVNSVDHAGRDLASSQLLGRDLSAAPWFVAIRDGKVAADETWVEPPTRDQLVGEVYGDDRVTLPFSAAITGPDGILAGVWHNEASFERVVDDIVASTQDDLRASGATTAEVQVAAGGDLLVQAHLFSGLDERSRDLPADLTDRPGASGQFAEVDDADRNLITGFAVTDGALGFPGYGWTILVSEERGAVLSAATALARSLVVFGVLLSVAIVGVSFLVASRLAKPMGAAAGKARGAAHGLKAVADELIATSEETSQRASDIAASTEQLNTAISVIAIALDELTSSFTEVARSATEASGIAQDAVDVAERSTATVTELGRSSEAIEGVLAIIRSLSEQTNMLALNASIEASRAGESGRGFAVVADSVKELSEGTARATQEIAGLVGQIQGDVLAAIDANASIKEAVERIRNHSALIAEATDEQSGTAADVARITASATHDANEIANSNMVLADAAERSWTAANAMQTSADAVAGMASDLTAIVLGDHD